MTSGAAPAEWLIVGRVRRSHGVRGELVVEPLTDSPGLVFRAGSRLTLGDQRGEVAGGGTEAVIAASRPFGEGLIVALEGVSDRNAADRLRERYILALRDALPAPAPGEIFIHDLVGLVVSDCDRELGPVTAFFESPAGLLLDVRTTKGAVLIPYRLEFVKVVDKAAGRLIVELPEGFLE
ncbi:MAG: ribosome maturation factor RimM [Gemmatimonadota bacterium]